MISGLILGRLGVDRRFGYKVHRAGELRRFFRWLDGAWYDVKELDGPRLSDGAVVEILQYEAITGEVMLFGCCCQVCAGNARLQAALKDLVARGLPEDAVSHGYWPEHTGPENDRIERQLKELTMA